MKIQTVHISKVIPNANNPRLIKNVKFKKLVASIKELPSMLKLRPIVVDDSFTILGGNMRYKACIEAGIKEVPVIVANELTEDEIKAFIIKDNVSYGEWDYDLLANEYDFMQLDDWAMDLPPAMFMTDDELENDTEQEQKICEVCNKILK